MHGVNGVPCTCKQGLTDRLCPAHQYKNAYAPDINPTTLSLTRSASEDKKYQSSLQSIRKPHKCPICNGEGKYDRLEGHDIFFGNVYQTVKCHSCNKGIIWG